jgi:hypothetical protein
MPDEKWVFWLSLTNIGLGIAVLLAMLAVGYGLVWEFVLKRKRARDLAMSLSERQARVQEELAHHLPIPELGWTMADGGEPVKSTSPQPAEKQRTKER